MVCRSNRDEVRNPILALPSVRAILDLPPESLAALALLLIDLVADARRRAQQSWSKNKGPMAVYWKGVGAYAEHLRRVVKRRDARRACERTAFAGSDVIDWTKVTIDEAPTSLPPPATKVLRLRVDLAGSLRNAIRALRGETRAFGNDDVEDMRECSVATLEMIIEHVEAVRNGDDETLRDFQDFYGLAPGAMLWPQAGAT